MQQQERGVRGVTADEVFIGNGVSELIDLTLRALLAADEEVLVPSPDYPLWTAAVNLNRGRAVHYPCRPEHGFVPDPRGTRVADHEAHARDRRDQPEQPDRRGLSARRARRHRAHRREASPRRVRGRDLRPDDVRRRRVRADGDARAPHAVLHDERPVQGLSRLRLSRRLGRPSRATSRTRANTSSGARAAVVAAPVQQRRRPVGRADGARRLPEHPRTGRARAGGCTSRARPSSTRLRAASSSR